MSDHAHRPGHRPYAEVRYLVARLAHEAHNQDRDDTTPTHNAGATEQAETAARPSTEWYVCANPPPERSRVCEIGELASPMATACRFQKVVQLPAKQRGCHIITRNLLQELPELAEYEVGMANLFGELCLLLYMK